MQESPIPDARPRRTRPLADTAAALAWLRDEGHAGRFRGVAMIDGNRAGHSFYDIVRGLSAIHDDAFTVEADDSFVCDQRMLDERDGPAGERSIVINDTMAGRSARAWSRWPRSLASTSSDSRSRSSATLAT